MGEVPEVVVLRLPLYLRILSQLNTQVVSSQQLGHRLQMTPAQIRKDLSYFGRFGKQGRGYSVSYLQKKLRSILTLDQEWNVGLIGVGRLGRAIMSYPGMTPERFQIVAAFDADPRQVGQVIGGAIVQPMHRLQAIIQSTDIRIAIVAVPAAHAQEVIDDLVECDVQAILNYAPISAQVPTHVKLRNIDPVLSLQSMTYYLK
jgi:redox-sensing transcriptional repressor